MSDKIAISVKNVSKSFKLPHEKHSGLKQALINFRPGRKYEQQHVLKGINFDIKEGEFFGIVGKNGSGKSTLLKLLAQIYTPNKGTVSINGTLTPFIELGVGFNPELTGRENVFLNGALLGFDRKQVSEMYDDIVSFAEIERFMDQKLKNYSSGMQVRLAFSIAIRAKTDILLIDEVLAVGDAAFQQKCFTYFEKLKKQKRTIVFVSHDMASVKQFCDKALLIDAGKIVEIGDPTEIARKYDHLNYSETEEVEEQGTEQGVAELKLLNSDGKAAKNFEYGEEIVLKGSWKKDLGVGIAGFVISKGTEVIFATNSIDQNAHFEDDSIKLRLNAKLGNGRYRTMMGLFGETRHDGIMHVDGPEFLVFGQPIKGSHEDEWEGLTYIENSWE